MTLPTELISRGTWGARPPKKTTPNDPIREIFIHHTSNKDANKITVLRQMYAAAQGIQNYHMDENGWSDIGYHFLIFQPGGGHDHAHVLQGRLPRYLPAAQLGHNPGTLAIAVYGNGFTDAMQRNTRFMIECLARDYAPGARGIGGHRDVVETDCPGPKFYAALDQIARATGLRRL